MSRTKSQDITRMLARSDEYKDHLVYVRDIKTFFLYEGRYYQRLEDDRFREMVYKHVESHYPEINLSINFVKDLTQQLAIQVLRKVDTIRTPYIALNDVLIDTRDFTTHSHTPDKFATHFMDFSYEEAIRAKCPRWETFMSEVLVKPDNTPDEELIDLMQEVFGYYIMEGVKSPHMFFLVGEGANGKSVLLDVLTAMIGEENCSAQSLHDLTTKEFSLASLVGKKVNICSEEESKYLRSDKFKAIVSGDLIEARQLYKDPIVFRVNAKFIFASNEVPTFEGLNNGLKRRINIIPFRRSFGEKEQNKRLREELLEELPGIFGWSLRGAQRLVDNGYVFTHAKALDDTKEEFVRNVSSALMFFAEEYKVDKNVNTPTSVLYDEYKNWCVANGKKPMSRQNFTKDIIRHYEDIEQKNLRRDGVRVRCLTASKKEFDGDDDIEFDITGEDIITNLPAL